MTERFMSRRALLNTALAAGGVVVGAGGVGTAEAMANRAPATGPHLPSPGEELMTEHGLLKRVLLAYRAMHDRLADGRTIDGGVVIDAAQIVSDYVESFHEGLEEAYVFPRVAGRQPQLVRTLLVQHDRGRHLTASISARATEGLHTESARTGLAADLAAFVRMYEPHEAWEDTVVYPTLRAVTPQRVLDQLAERFADLENAQYGDSALTTMLGRVEGIEQQLGIGDLTSFTPAAP
jgi:hemerythrin-like domain-containing protein